MHTSTSMIAITILGASILCWLAFLNGFSLVLVDFGNYREPAILHYAGRNALPFHGIFVSATGRRINLCALGLAGLLALVVIERHRPALGTSVMMLAILAGEASITGAFSGIESRYASRAAWAMAFIPCIVLTRYLLARQGRPGIALSIMPVEAVVLVT